MKIFQADVFTDSLFSGNPAVVIPLDNWPDPLTMQQVAAENNVSETVFFKQREDESFEIRWFTTDAEIDLGGHATIAAAHVLVQHLGYPGFKITFYSKSGSITVEKKEDVYWLYIPSRPPKPVPVPKQLPEALGTVPLYTGLQNDLLVLVNDDKTVLEIMPDLHILAGLDSRGVIVTAKASEPGVDFVSRYFAPAVGMPENPVSGSAHTVLIPFWAKRMGKQNLVARQLSKRGGFIQCKDNGERVGIGGRAITYLSGEIYI